MNEKRRALGRGLGALIPAGPDLTGRPVDLLVRPSVATTPASPRAWDPGAVDADRAVDHPRDAAADTRDPRSSVEGTPTASAHEGNGLQPVPGARFTELPIDAIRPNPRQPRTVFDDDELTELAGSIREVGVLQPVVVRSVTMADGAPSGPMDDGIGDGGDGGTSGGADGEPAIQAAYELVMGERRWRAAKLAGLSTVSAIVRETSDHDLLRDALLENLHRAQLNPLEEAAAYQQLLDDFGCTQDELAARVSRSRPQISNTLRLLRLPASVQRRVAAGVLSAGHARAVLALTDGAAMERLAQRIVAEGLSVRATEEAVALGVDADAPVRTRATARSGGADLGEVESLLADRFDTRVTVSLGRRTGRLTVEFATLSDLDRILQVMGVERAAAGGTYTAEGSTEGTTS